MASRQASIDVLKDTVARRGRPRSQVPHASVMTWVPADVHDKLIRVASRREISVSALVRDVLIFTLK